MEAMFKLSRNDINAKINMYKNDMNVDINFNIIPDASKFATQANLDAEINRAINAENELNNKLESQENIINGISVKLNDFQQYETDEMQDIINLIIHRTETMIDLIDN